MPFVRVVVSRRPSGSPLNMNGAARSVPRPGPPSMLKSMRSTATGDVTLQAIAPETVSAVGETKFRAASEGGGEAPARDRQAWRHNPRRVRTLPSFHRLDADR